MRLFTFRLATGLLAAGCVAFLATAYSEHRSLDDLSVKNEERVRALQTQLQLRRLGILLVDLETGQRGFLITGQIAFLAPFERANQELSTAYEGLKAQLANNPVATPVLARLDRLIVQRVAQADRNVARRFEVGEEALKDLPSYVAGRQLMDDIRQEIGKLEDQQASRIADAEQSTRAVQDRTDRLSSVLPLAGLMLMAGAVSTLWVERRRRDVAEQALKAANASLESTVTQRTAALRSALDRIQSFAAELDRGIEAERVRLAREVHDQIGQVGTATKMLVLGLRRKIAPAKEEALDELLTMADEVIAMARQISATLRPPLLDDFGLGAAIGHYVKSLARQGTLAVDVAVHDDGQLSAEQRTQLFRILQEAGTNVLRHAQATELRIAGHAGDTHYCLEIIDNGVGPGSVRPDASGLRNMRERAAMAGGKFSFGAGTAGGTRVSICLPLPRQDDTADSGWAEEPQT